MELTINDLIPIMPNNDKIEKFCDYVLENYILPDSKFPPEMWAEYTATTTRTTNACESFHSRLNSLIPAPHPNIFKMIDILLGFQSETICKLNQRTDVKRKIIVIKKERFVGSLMKKMEDGLVTRKEFVAQVSMKFLPLFH
uniref:Uncharacterized protein n=2 Tax=Cacopsylla melanoneura TaxID=428564 RepID=A0A8D8QSY9_9HEMI